ncbi:MAG: Fe-S cluster assembly protein SufD [Coxiellaceae bacterium]|nr:Fe-S cluster assembly protein SufD [Coxiellaceae bacterium]
MNRQAIVERWKYTDLSALEKVNWQARPDEAAEDAIIFAETDEGGPIRLVFVDGQLDESLSQLERLPKQINCQVNVAELPEKNLLLGKSSIPYIKNSSCLEVLLSVAEDYCSDELIYALFIVSEQSNQCLLPITLNIDIGENAKVAIQCEYVSYRNVQSFHQLITNINLQKGAELQHYCVQKEGDSAFYWQQKNIAQQDNSDYYAFDLMLGGQWARLDVKHHLQGEQAQCKHHGFYHTNQSKQHNVYLDVYHEQPDCKSEQYFKGIIDDQAHAVFNTKVTVTEHGHGSHAAQDNHNLLLSSKAEIDTKPDLEIYNDDVACSHGATVGNLNQDALFYLRSRGIDENQSRAMLTHSFAVELLEQIKQPLVYEGMKAELINALGE